MRVLLTTQYSDKWRLFVKEIGLPSTSEITHHIDDQVISSTQSLLTLHQLMENSPPSLQINLAVVSAEYFIAEATEKGGSAQEAADVWTNVTNAVLMFQRQYRLQVKLFNLHEAITNFEKFIEIFGYGSTKKNVIDCRIESLPFLAANYFVINQSQLHSINLRLIATCVPLLDTNQPPLNIDVAIQEYKTTKARVIELEKNNAVYFNSQKELSASKEQSALLLSQLHHVQEKLEEYYLNLKSASKENTRISADNKQLVKEIHLFKEQTQKLTARAESAEYSVSMLGEELGRYKRSLVWKLMAPARALSRLIKRETRSGKKLQQEIDRLSASFYFDSEWYLNQYPDVAENQMNPAEHYLLYGANEGRFPSLLFDGNWYKQQYPDVADSGINPLLHFLTYGLKEGRNCLPVTRK